MLLYLKAVFFITKVLFVTGCFFNFICTLLADGLRFVLSLVCLLTGVSVCFSRRLDLNHLGMSTLCSTAYR